ncbi:MAG: hypothetical protein ISS93_03660 [Candidatus Aenigmarchaeota archaeon]|nr:hypothetical protein [Candidatus Aenigmarchaeota archaeon]
MKAQIWSLDLIISVVIFTTMIALFFFTFNTLSADAEEHNSLSKMQDISLEVTEALIRTSGLPSDWNNETVQVIGFAVNENVLDGDKVLYFVNTTIDYNRSKVLMGIGNYEYYFQIDHPNGTVVELSGLNLIKGVDYATAKTIVRVERFVVLSGLKKLKFTLWR